MRRNRNWHGLESAILLLILGAGISSAQADPITIPGYTVTDLGAGTPTFSTDANGNGVLNAPNGQVYAFSQTPNTVLTPGQGTSSQGNTSDAVLYNMNSHTLIDLTRLFSSASGGIYRSGGDYLINQPIALDADGRILLSATEFNPIIGFTQTNLLLTPDGLSSAPLEVPAPEPGTLAVGVLAIAGFVAHRLFERRQNP